MLLIKFPNTSSDKLRGLSFWLAAEEYVGAHIGEILGDSGCDSAFFTWKVGPSVIFGHNQEVEAEVNVPYCAAEGIPLFRRKSGGGCVYADEGNIMLSAIYGSGNVQFHFASFLERLALSLRQLGFEAARSSRNDIIVDGRKVAGSACFVTPSASIVHSTLMYNLYIDRMVNAITPPAEKLERHGVSSVRSRVANLKELMPSLVERSLISRVTACFCPEKRSFTLDASAIAEIEKAAETYLDPVFVMKK